MPFARGAFVKHHFSFPESPFHCNLHPHFNFLLSRPISLFFSSPTLLTQAPNITLTVHIVQEKAIIFLALE